MSRLTRIKILEDFASYDDDMGYDLTSRMSGSHRGLWDILWIACL